MRLILLILSLLVSCLVCAQKDAHLTGNLSISEIAAMEMEGHQRLATRLTTSFTNASTNFDVKYYRAEWEVDPAIRYIKGKVTVYYMMTSTDNTISFDLDNAHTVSSVLQRNVPLATSHINNTLQITFPASVNLGEVDSVSIFYEGNPPNTASGSFVASTHGTPGIPVMWTLSEPYGSKDWWPCKNGLDDKADDGIDLFITHPTNYNETVLYKAAANGTFQSETKLPGNKTRTHWKHTYAIASYLVCFAVTNYTIFDNHVMIGAEKLPMQTYCYPESEAVFAAGAQNALDALQLFSNLFGTYPFIREKYGHVQFGWGGGMEHQTSSFIINVSESLVVHELAHQWFGDKITCGNWEDIWLNEGFATHLASIYMENKYPSSALTRRANEIANITSQPVGSVKVDDVSNVNRIFSNRLSYSKGSHLLYMLRWILGDAVFFDAIRSYQNDASLAYNFARTEDLKRHLEAVSGKDLDYFFNQWFIGQGYPSYQLEWSASGESVAYNLKQTTSDASVSFFKLPVPLLFKNNTTGQSKLVVADHTFNGQNFSENLGFAAESVTIDPEHWLISKNNTVIKTSGPLPVTYTYTRAACVGSSVVLSWGTSSEVNSESFEIQKSTDAIHWATIGTLEASGNSFELKKYTFTDPSESGKQAYYKIVENDINGNKQYARILEKECSKTGERELTASPNPLRDQLMIHPFGQIPLPYLVQIYHVSGKLAMERKQDNTGKIDVSELTPGLYLLKLKAPDGSFFKVIKFVKE